MNAHTLLLRAAYFFRSRLAASLWELQGPLQRSWLPLCGLVTWKLVSYCCQQWVQLVQATPGSLDSKRHRSGRVPVTDQRA